MKIEFISDLHIERTPTKNIKPFFNNPDEKESILVLGGDNGTSKDFIEFLCSKYKQVVLILGNHDFWHHTPEQIKMYYSGIAMQVKNFVFLDNKTLHINDVAIHGTTLWTDFKNMNPLVVNKCEKHLNDFNYIKFPQGKTKPESIAEWNKYAIEFLKSALVISGKQYKNIIVSHFAPSLKFSGVDVFRDFDLAEYFSSNKAENEIVYNFDNIDYWLFGHTHVNYKEELKGIKFISNSFENINEYPQRVVIEV